MVFQLCLVLHTLNVLKSRSESFVLTFWVSCPPFMQRSANMTVVSLLCIVCCYINIRPVWSINICWVVLSLSGLHWSSIIHQQFWWSKRRLIYRTWTALDCTSTWYVYCYDMQWYWYTIFAKKGWFWGLKA